MPCIRNDNGQPVPGAQGQCPIGSSWMPESQQLTDLTAADKDIMQNAEKGTGIFGQDVFGAGGVDIGPSAIKTGITTGLGALASAPFLKAGFNYGKKKVLDPKNISRLKTLMNKAFRRFDEPVRAAFPIMNKAQQAAWRKANPGKWNLDKLKLLGWGGAGGLSIQTLMDSLGDNDTVTKGELSEKQKTLMASGSDSGRRGKATLNPQETSRSGGTFEQTSMQKLGANMKDPKWWTESISGLPSDTRLMRMGQLMDYYGKKPKGREAATAPSKLWAENEAAAQAAQAKVLASGNSGSNFLSKFSSEDQDAAIRSQVESKLGVNDWNPMTGPSGSNDAAVDTTVAKVKGLIQQLVQGGMPWSDALTLAMSKVTQ